MTGLKWKQIATSTTHSVKLLLVKEDIQINITKLAFKGLCLFSNIFQTLLQI